MASILWAVRVFQQQTEEKVQERIRSATTRAMEEDEMTEGPADGIRVRCFGGGGSNQELSSLSFQFINENEKPAALLAFSLEGATLGGSAAQLVPGIIPAWNDDGQNKPRRGSVSRPTGRVQRPPNPFAQARIRYRVAGGPVWERTGDGRPSRHDPTA